MAINSNILKNKNKTLLAPPNTISSTAYRNEVLTTVNNIFTSQDRATIPGRDIIIPNPTPKPLSITITNLASASLDIGDATSLSDWNDFFETDIYADTAFTSINIVETEIQLFGATILNAKASLFSPNKNGYSWLVSIDDQAESIVDVSYGVFAQCQNLQNVNLPAVKRIGSESFIGCLNLSSFTANLVQMIQSYAFQDCDNLTSINLPECLFLESSYVFSYCNLLTTVNLPKLQFIGESSFSNSTSLQTLYIPSLLSTPQDRYDYSIFTDISGNDITLTIPNRFMTCDNGNIQPDIQYLLDNNTVTLITV